jgi:uracil-DNA glycosylase family 4
MQVPLRSPDRPSAGSGRPELVGGRPIASSPDAQVALVRRAIVECNACPRLRQYCQRIGVEKRKAFRDQEYWARPVPGFGDPQARIVLVGLAPAAHGGNRTGRVFTGDGAGGSGDFLMAALHANGLANQPYSRGLDDGLQLRDTWIAAAVRCAPPDNKPTPEEIATCHTHLRAEIRALPRARVFVALGRIAFDACWRLILERRHDLHRPAKGTSPLPRLVRPPFAHGAVWRSAELPALVASYHPSRQNTHTGRLTPAMLRSVFRRAKALVIAARV